MSITTTETCTSSASESSAPPELTILTRVASIPIICSSLESLDSTLSANAYTRSPYCTAKGLSTSALKYTEPLQVRLAPFIVRADGYANKAVDVVESRYPYPFKAKPEEVASYVREKGASAVDVANKTLDERVKNPAYHVAEGIDQRFAPIVDYFEDAVTRLNSEAGPSTHPDSKYQYQRALALSKSLKDQIYDYSNEQIKQFQTQSVLVQRATETAQSVATLASSSLTSAQTHIHSLSDAMLLELQKLQTSLANSASTSASQLQSSIQTQIPAHLQQSFSDLSTNLSSTITDVTAILTTKDLPLQEKATRVGSEVRDRVLPLLDNVQKRISEVLGGKKAQVNQPPTGRYRTQ